MYKIGKDFTWEMGHRLFHHDGLCSNPHGHSYKMIVKLEGEIDNETGMILDYYKLDKIVWEILEDFNHCFVVNENDSIMKKFLIDNDFKSVVLPFDSTAENLCDMFCNILSKKFCSYKNIKQLTIKINETSDVFAEQSIKL